MRKGIGTLLCFRVFRLRFRFGFPRFARRRRCAFAACSPSAVLGLRASRGAAGVRSPPVLRRPRGALRRGVRSPRCARFCASFVAGARSRFRRACRERRRLLADASRATLALPPRPLGSRLRLGRARLALFVAVLSCRRFFGAQAAGRRGLLSRRSVVFSRRFISTPRRSTTCLRTPRRGTPWLSTPPHPSPNA